MKKNMIPPVVVTVVMILYYVLYFGFLMRALEGVWKYAFGLIPLALSGVMIGVCVQRIKEIKKGEEDDLSQY